MSAADAINTVAPGSNTTGGVSTIWDDEDSFFYDVLRLPDGSAQRLKVRSMVGLLPLLAVETLEPDVLDEIRIHAGSDPRQTLREIVQEAPDDALLDR